VTRSLVIVESPAKAKTIGKYLGDGYVVESSIGHIRDLAKPAQLPKDKKKSSAYIKEYAVDVENGYEPFYLVSPDRKQQITKLKKLVKESDELLLATDEDREGESIAWHLVQVLKPKVPVKRMVFHEITKKAILDAVASPREVDANLVEAQEARRVLDRLYGFGVTNLLRRKAAAVSAGRVQSVALRVIVERERERMAHVKAGYWSVAALFENPDAMKVETKLRTIDGKRVAEGRDFGDDGKLKKPTAVALLDEPKTKALVAELEKTSFTVTNVERRPFTKRPSPPFMTSTLQQEAGRKLRFPAQRTMRTAQRLYEGGLITYMRTDSTNLSATALSAARSVIKKLYDPADLPAQPRTYAKKSKNAQEAHEAIRPAGDDWPHPTAVAKKVTPDEANLYELIWKRTVASQMADAKGERLVVTIGATTASGKKVELQANGNSYTFQGFRKAYVEGSDDPEAELDAKETHLPPLKKGEALTPKSFEPKSHETQPPSRYTEASLVKRLEELGVGRPSTYASIMQTILEPRRGYATKRGSALVPTFKALQVIRLLEDHLPHLVDYAFTARMEDDLDEIVDGKETRAKYLERFFRGAEEYEGLEELLAKKRDNIDIEEQKRLETFPLGETDDGKEIFVKVGRGASVFFGRRPKGDEADENTERAFFDSDEVAPDEVTLEEALKRLDAPSKDRELGTDPETGKAVRVKYGMYGYYVQLGEDPKKGDKDAEKPKRASLFESMDAETLTLQDALKLLSQPRVVGTAPDGEEVTARNGRNGPFLSKGKENRSLETEEQIFSITLEEALKVLAQPRKRRRAKPPLKTLGKDGVSGETIVVKDGRFGAYVTDGETNASLTSSDKVETLPTERAIELLAARRAKGGGGKKKKSTKKATKKKSTKKTRKAAK